jgi:hypothetical protein
MPLLGKREEVNGAVRYQTLAGHTKDVVWVLRQLMQCPGFLTFLSSVATGRGRCEGIAHSNCDSPRHR